MEKDEQKCTFIGCKAVGVPEPEFDFYACEECCRKLDQMIEQKYQRN